MACDEYHHHCTQDLRRPHPRVPDERPRLRAARRPARDGGLRRRQQPARGCPARGGRRRRLQHLRGARERRQQALRQPRPAAPGQDAQPRHADRRRRLHGAEGPRHHRRSGRPGSTSSSAPTTSAACRPCSTGPATTSAPRSRSSRASRSSPSTLPTRRDSAYAGWVSISVGCNNTCTFCIVPSLRGKEADRRPGDVLAEIKALVEQGVVEVTLLGQNVNTYGVEFGDRLAFGKLLRACGEIDGPRAGAVHQPAPGGLHRRRHRRDGRDPQRHAEPAHAAAVGVGPGAQGDAPVLPQRRSSSGSSTGSASRSPTPRSPPTSSSASRARPRRTSRGRCGSCASRGSPARSPSSTRSAPGTPAATMPDQVPKAVVQERYERLIAVQEEISWAENRTRRGARGRGPRRHRRGPQGHRDAPPVRSGPRQPAGPLRRARRRRAAAPGRPGHGRCHLRRAAPPRRRRGPGGGAYAVRRTAGGDAWAALQDAPARASRASPWVCRGSADPRPSPPRRAVELPLRAPTS